MPQRKVASPSDLSGGAWRSAGAARRYLERRDGRSEKHRGELPGASRLPIKEGDVSAWLPAAQPTAIGLPVGSLNHSL